MKLHAHPIVETEYTFLAHPPPHKKHSKQPHPVECLHSQTIRRRSNTFSGIVAWATHVQPGSPAPLSPHSPHRRPFIRNPSATLMRAPSTSSHHLTPTPPTVHVTTPSVRDFKTDLTTVGYTSIFLHLPDTPISAMLSFSINTPNTAFPNPPGFSPTRKSCSLTRRFRSLSATRSRGRVKSVTPNSPSKMKARDAAASAAIIKHKKSKYAIRPPPLANELTLMQFVDGGSMDDNIKRAMETRARSTGIASHGDVYRDGVGGVWLDQDEKLEYTHLLTERGDSRLQHPQWVTFCSDTPKPATWIAEDERRESVSTQNSALDPNRMVQPVDLLGGDDPALLGNALASPIKRTPGLSILAIPSRPNRAAKHLLNPKLLVDVAFSHHHASPNSPESLKLSDASLRLKEKERKRPAPLNLSPPSPASKWPVNSPVDNARQEFIQNSFQPIPGSASTTSVAISDATQLDVRARLVGSSGAVHMPQRTRTINGGSMGLGMKTKKSMLNIKGLFRSGKK